MVQKVDKRILFALFILIISIGFLIFPHQDKNLQKNLNINNLSNISGNGEIKFIAIGDPHVKQGNSKNRGNERLENIVNFINNRKDIDFAVILGDSSDDGENKTFQIVKNIMSSLDVPYFIVAGNHDIYISRKEFESNFGPMEHIENIKGYQLLFIGISNKTEKGRTTLNWTFDFNKANKSAPTIVFLHGAVEGPPPNCLECNWGPSFFRYGQSMLPELNKFTDLIGVYSGHVHYSSDQRFNNVEFITIDGLIAKSAGGIVAQPSDNIGYSIINDSELEYNLIPYE